MTQEEQQEELQKKLDKKISDARLRSMHLANTIIMKPEGRDPYVLDAIAQELRHLAFQMRFYEKAKTGAFLAM